jgi:hypothetical protein
MSFVGFIVTVFRKNDPGNTSRCAPWFHVVNSNDSVVT